MTQKYFAAPIKNICLLRGGGVCLVLPAVVPLVLPAHLELVPALGDRHLHVVGEHAVEDAHNAALATVTSQYGLHTLLSIIKIFTDFSDFSNKRGLDYIYIYSVYIFT